MHDKYVDICQMYAKRVTICQKYTHGAVLSDLLILDREN